jgi:hypothetical protein
VPVPLEANQRANNQRRRRAQLGVSALIRSARTHTLSPVPVSRSAIVVRGGTNRDPAILREHLFDAIDDGDGAVISVYVGEAEPSESIEQAVARICIIADIPHGQVQVSDRLTLESLGFTIVLDVDEGEPENHHHVVFREPLDDSQIQGFMDAFGEPIPNPIGGKRRRQAS